MWWRSLTPITSACWLAFLAIFGRSSLSEISWRVIALGWSIRLTKNNQGNLAGEKIWKAIWLDITLVVPNLEQNNAEHAHSQGHRFVDVLRNPAKANKKWQHPKRHIYQISRLLCYIHVHSKKCCFWSSQLLCLCHDPPVQLGHIQRAPRQNGRNLAHWRRPWKSLHHW